MKKITTALICILFISINFLADGQTKKRKRIIENIEVLTQLSNEDSQHKEKTYEVLFPLPTISSFFAHL